MLEVDFTKRIGELTLKNSFESLPIFKCNALAAVGKIGDDGIELVEFWADASHLKNILGLSDEYKDDNLYKDKVESITLIGYSEEGLEIAKCFYDAGIKVVYYF